MLGSHERTEREVVGLVSVATTEVVRVVGKIVGNALISTTNFGTRAHRSALEQGVDRICVEDVCGLYFCVPNVSGK